jgi:hypothetical protein
MPLYIVPEAAVKRPFKFDIFSWHYRILRGKEDVG